MIRGPVLAVLLGLSAATVAGCGGDAPVSEVVTEPSPSPTRQGPATFVSQESLVTVQVTGARALEWEGPQTLSIGRAGGPGRSVNIFSVGMLEPANAGSAVIRWAFDLIGEFRDEAGDYRLSGEPGLGGVKSVAFIRFYDSSESPKETAVFNEVREPCMLQLNETGGIGTLECPQLVDAQGTSVHLRVTWTPSL